MFTSSEYVEYNMLKRCLFQYLPNLLTWQQQIHYRRGSRSRFPRRTSYQSPLSVMRLFEDCISHPVKAVPMPVVRTD